MDGGRAQAFLARIGESRQGQLARDFEKLRENANSNASCEPRRRSNLKRRRRRSSLFDITTDTVAANHMNNNGGGSQSPILSMQASSEISNIKLSKPETSGYPTAPIYPMAINNPVLTAACPRSSKSMAEFDLNENKFMDQSPLSLNLSLSISSEFLNSLSSSSSRHSAFQAVQSISYGDSIISVA